MTITRDVAKMATKFIGAFGIAIGMASGARATGRADVEWDYFATNGIAVIGKGGYSDRAIPLSTVGAIEIPAELDGFPVGAIAPYAFRGCINLTSITIPSCVTNIGWNAFEDCKSLTSISLPPSMRNVPNWLVAGCSSLEELVIPEGVTTVGNYIIRDCTSLKRLVLPSMLRSAADSAFADAPALMEVVGLEDVESCNMGYSVFSGDSSLKRIDLSHVYLGGGGNGFLQDCMALGEVVMPLTGCAIGERFFAGCTSLTNVVGAWRVCAIGKGAFTGCSSLERFVIYGNGFSPSADMAVTNDTFVACNSIGTFAFVGCTNLTNVVFRGGPPQTDGQAFGPPEEVKSMGMTGIYDTSHKAEWEAVITNGLWNGLTMVCRRELAVTAAALPPAMEKVAYEAQLVATNGTMPYAWSLRSGEYSRHSDEGSFKEVGSAQGWQADDACWEIELPFDFPFYESTYRKVYVSSNGTLAFDGYLDEYIASRETFTNRAMIAVLWNDLQTSYGDIYVAASADSVTIRWNGFYFGDTSHMADTNPIVAVSATLFRDGTIRLSYFDGTTSEGMVGVSSGDGERFNVSEIFFVGAGETDIVFRRVGGLPDGLALSEDGRISGVPTMAGTNTFTVIVADAAGETAMAEQTIVVKPNPNLRPVIEEVCPATNVVFKADEWAVFLATAYDPEESDLVYTWILDGSVVGVSTNEEQFVFKTHQAQGGSHALTCFVSDGFWTNEVRHTWSFRVLRDWYVDAAAEEGAGDGSSAESAFVSLSDAVSMVADGDTIYVAPGTYEVPELFTEGSQFSIIAAEGQCRTFLRGRLYGGPEKLAMLKGFTLKGFGAYGISLRDCILTGDEDGNSSSANRCFLENCFVTGNRSGWDILESCEVVRCTLAGNVVRENGVICSGYEEEPGIVRDSIVWGNVTADGALSNYDRATWTADDGTNETQRAYVRFENSCTWPMPLEAANAGNITNDPYLVDAANGDLRLRVGSPCLDANGVQTMGARWGDPVEGVVLSVRIDGNGGVSPMTAVVPAGDSATFAVTNAVRPFLGFSTNGVFATSDEMLVWPNVTTDGIVTAAFSNFTFHVDAATGNDANDGLSWESPKASIQAAIDATRRDETILVKPGTYAPIMTEGHPSLRIVGIEGKTATLIDGGGTNACARLYCSAGESTLVGFTITNGCWKGEADARSYGGGVSDGTIEDCDVVDCSSGGIVEATAIRCRIFGNKAESGGYGAYCVGGAYYSTLVNCLVADNAGQGAEATGGTLGSTLYNCTVVGNSAEGSWTVGGVRYGELYNTIVYGNSAVTGTSACVVSDIASLSRQEGCLIGIDPGFVDAANGDYRLSDSSPCIDAGRNSFVQGDHDLDGNSRLVNGTVDIGCYEWQNVPVVPLPDLAASAELIGPQAAVWCPGDTVTVRVVTHNVGTTNALAPWRNQLSLVNDSGARASLLTWLNETNLSEGACVTNLVTCAIPELVPLAGSNLCLSVTLDIDDAVEEVDNEANNVCCVPLSDVSLGKCLYLSAASAEMKENVASGVRFTVRRSGPVDEALSVTVGAADAASLSVPATVTIPAGSVSTIFTVTPVDNSLVDGARLVPVSVSADGFRGAFVPLTILDDEVPRLSVSLSQTSIREGDGVIIVTVTREGPLDEPLTVYLNGGSSRVSLPASVVIPAGEASITFEISVPDNDTAQVAANLTLRASAAGYVSASADYTVEDDDVPGVTLTLSPETVSEGAGARAVYATLARSDTNHIAQAVRVRLTASEANQLILPGEVTIPKYTMSVRFAIGVIDNALDDGDREVTVNGAVVIESCGCDGQPSNGDVIQATLGIIDNDGPALALVADPATMREGLSPAGYLTLSHNSTLAEDLTVRLWVDEANADEIALPETVTISAGETSVRIPVTTLDDGVEDGSQLVSVYAEDAAGVFAAASTWIQVSDQNLPDFQVASVETVQTVVSKEVLSVSFVVTNVGFMARSGAIPYAVHLVKGASGGTVSSATLVKSGTLTGDLAVNGSLSDAVQVTAPELPGDYRVAVVLDPDGTISELDAANNTGWSPTFAVGAAYTATAGVDGDKVYLPESEVTVRGKAVSEKGDPVAFVPVEVYLLANGGRRTLAATTDADGNYVVSFSPHESDAGHYSVGACYPGEDSFSVLDAFDVLGMRCVAPATLTFDMIVGESSNATVRIKNCSDVALSGLSVSFSGVPAGCDIVCEPNHVLSGGAFMDMTITCNASIPTLSDGDQYVRMTTTVTSEEGVVLTFPVYFYAEPQRAYLRVTPRTIDTTMTVGEVKYMTVEIENAGKADSGCVKIDLPSADWLRLVGGQTIENIAPGDTAVLTLEFTPSETMPLSVAYRNAAIGICAENGYSLSVPFSVIPVSERTGSLTVKVSDCKTIYGGNAAYVSNATVVVRNRLTAEVVARMTTGADGTCRIDDLPMAYYGITVSAANHSTKEVTMEVPAGIDSTCHVYLDYAVSYAWQVVPTTVEDQYAFNLVAEYETNVPAPVLKVHAPEEIPAIGPGESHVCTITVENQGLVAINDVKIGIDGTIGDYVFEQLSPDIGTLPALSSRDVTVRFLLPDSQKASRSARAKLQNSGLEDYEVLKESNPCTFGVLAWGYSLCGDRGVELVAKSGNIRFMALVCDLLTNIAKALDFGNTKSPGTKPTRRSGGSDGGKRDFVPVESVSEVDCECIINAVNKLMGLGFFANATKLKGYDEFAKLYDSSDICDFMGKACSSASSVFSEDEQGLDSHIAKAISAVESALGVYESCKASLGENKYLELAGPTIDAYKKAKEAVSVYRDLRTAVRSISGLKDLLEKDREAVIGTYIQRRWLAGAVAKASDYEALFAYRADLKAYVDKEKWRILCARVNLLFRKIREICPDSTDSESVLHMAALANVMTAANDVELPDDCSDLMTPDLEQEVTSDFEAMTNALQSVATQKAQWKKEGLNGLSAVLSSVQEMMEQYVAGGEAMSVCAKVTLRFDQTATLTREAFEGKLTLVNGADGFPLEGIHLDLEVTDEEGYPRNDLFGITGRTTWGALSGDDITLGNCTLPGGETGGATVLFVPTVDAAPTEPKTYYFGGTLHYHDKAADEEMAVRLAAVPIRVSPCPFLRLDYFLQRDVCGDNPFTKDAVEPSVPAELAMLVRNIGVGTAQNVRVHSVQPEILENDMGLAIDFKLNDYDISGSALNGTSRYISLRDLNLGDIKPGDSAVAQWWLTSTLEGHFTGVKASVSQLDSWGNPNTSLIAPENVVAHRLVRSIVADGDGLPAFLTCDTGTRPDMIFRADGEVLPVCVAMISSEDEALIIGMSELTVLSRPSQTGWNYGSVVVPGIAGSVVTRVVRADGSEVPMRNVWLTDRTFRDGATPLREERLHMVDDCTSVAAQTYTVTLAAMSTDVPEVASFEGVADGGVEYAARDAVTVTFTKPIDAATFTADDLSLTKQGESVDDLSALTITAADETGTRFTIGNLFALCGDYGRYELTVQCAGIADVNGNLGRVGKSVAWTFAPEGSAVPQLSALSRVASDGFGGATFLASFDRAVVPTCVSLVNWTLRRNGNSVAWPASAQVVVRNAAEYVLSGIDEALNEDGVYELTFSATGVADAAGHAVTGEKTISWTVDRTPPACVSDLRISPDGGFSDSDGITWTRELTVAGTLPEDGLTVEILCRYVGGSETVLAMLEADATSASRSFAQPIVLPGAGNVTLVVRLTDAAGNSSDTEKSVFVDVLALTGTLSGAPTDTAVVASTATLAFSDRVMDGDVSLDKFTLARDGKPLELQGVSLVKVDDVTFTFTGLDALCAEDGAYVLRFDGTAVRKHLSGLMMGGTLALRWRYEKPDRVPPTVTVVLFDGETPHEAYTNVFSTIAVTFSEAVNAPELIENGLIGRAARIDLLDAANVVTGSAAVVQAATWDARGNTLAWTIDPATVPVGRARLTLEAGLISDLAGNRLSADGSQPVDGLCAYVPAEQKLAQVNAQAMPCWQDGTLYVGEKTADGVGKIRRYAADGTWSYLQSDSADIEIPSEGCQGASVAFADMDGDGETEIYVGTADGRVLKYPGGEEIGLSLANGRAMPFAVDLNGDGRDELIVGGLDGRLRVLSRRVEGGVRVSEAQELLDSTGAPLKVPNGRAAPVVADINNDGSLDILSGDTAGNIWAFLGEGSAWCAQPVAVFANTGDMADRSRLGVGDVDGDGVADLVVGRSDGSVTLLRGVERPTPSVAFEVCAFTLAMSVNAEDLEWTTGGAAEWQPVWNADAYDGQHCAQSGVIGNDTNVWIETTVEGAGVLSFAWRCSTEARYDMCQLLVDGEVKGVISGETPWTTNIVALVGGSHTVRWNYRKSRSGAAGEDRVWLDAVSWAPEVPLTLAEALNPDLFWETKGDVAWTAVRKQSVLEPRDGWAVAEGLSDYGFSSLETLVYGAGTLTFDWAVSCEDGYDWFDFLIDGEVRASITGETEWKTVTVEFADAGRHVLKWEYWKDDMDEEGLAGENRAKLDNVVWTPLSADSQWTVTTPDPISFDVIRTNYGAYWKAAKGDYEEAAHLFGRNGYAIWQSYVAGLNPDEEGSRFKAKIEMVDGQPVVTWEPDTLELRATRTYTTYGKKTLLDRDWTPVTDANRGDYNFFKVEVRMK